MARRLSVLLPVLLALAMLALLLRLGFWQLDRARYKEELLAQRSANAERAAVAIARIDDAKDDSGESYFRAARARGRFDDVHQYLLDNRTHHGRAGFYVLSPLAVDDGVILVNRGWVPLGATRQQLPPLEPLPAQPVEVLGRLSPPPSSGLLLGDDGHRGQSDWPRVVQSADLEAIARTLGRPVAPLTLLLDPSDPACHVCEWKPVSGIGPETHRGYAVQWFALAVALVVLCALVLRRRRSHDV